jgi:MscS family membrane protein
MIDNNLIYAVIVLSTFLFLRVIFRKVIVTFLKKLTSKTKTDFDDNLLDSIKKPIDFIIIIIGVSFAKDLINIDSSIDIILNNLIRSAFAFGIFWIIFNALTPLSIVVHKFTSKFGANLSNDIANFIVKTLKFLVLAIGFVSILQEWGYNISGFLASLGLVGMAFALAAKDTAANLFGSLVIFSDRPFKIGDWIKTPDVEGTIETIGIRSTKVRTFAQAIVTVPNAVLANSAILNWSQMGKRRIKMELGLTYDTSISQMEQIVFDIKDMLKNHSDIHQDTMHIYFTKFDSSSLNIFCYYFTKTTNWGEFMSVKEDTNFKIMKIIEKNNAKFAFPSKSIYIEKGEIN